MEPTPNFRDEAEEAAWWDAHPEALTQRFRAARQKGQVRRLSNTSLPGAAEAATLRLSAEDQMRAHTLAAKRGLSCQVYLQQLVHEALNDDERKLAS